MERDDWKAAMDEVDLPEPAPGKKIITFSLPEVNIPATRRPAKPQPEEKIGLDEAEIAKMNLEDYAALADSPRRRAREAAFLVLFAVTMGCEWEQVGNILADVQIEPDSENGLFAVELARAAFAQREDSDRLLSEYAREWDVERFSAVDLAVLRLAMAELVSGDDDLTTIVINEAIELAKKFGSEKSGSFVNGILDNIKNNALHLGGGAE